MSKVHQIPFVPRKSSPLPLGVGARLPRAACFGMMKAMQDSATLNPQLLLANVRQVLVRLEETIVFALIERAQFRGNAIVYRRGAFPALTADESLMGHLLHETERVHAGMRRYTSPDEQPFFADLPPPRLPTLAWTENPLRPNTVNLNAELRQAYEAEIVPTFCAAGDDGQYGSAAVCDVACLQALSRRVHYGKFVAESKRRQDPARLNALAQAGSDEALLAVITHAAVEQEVLERVSRKASTYVAELRRSGAAAVPDPERIVAVYARWVIPLNKRVQVAYLRASC